MKWIPCHPPKYVGFVLWMICLPFFQSCQIVWMHDEREVAPFGVLEDSEVVKFLRTCFLWANWTEAFEQYGDHWFLTGSWLHPQMLTVKHFATLKKEEHADKTICLVKDEFGNFSSPLFLCQKFKPICPSWRFGWALQMIGWASPINQARFKAAGRWTHVGLKPRSFVKVGWYTKKGLQSTSIPKYLLAVNTYWQGLQGKESIFVEIYAYNMIYVYYLDSLKKRPRLQEILEIVVPSSQNVMAMSCMSIQATCIHTSPWKMVLGRLVSYWEDYFSGTMFNFGRVYWWWTES